MKYHVVFLGLLSLVLAALSYLTLTFNDRGTLHSSDAESEILNRLDDFRKRHRPIMEVNFSTLYGTSGRFQVLHPLLEMRKLRIKPSPTCEGVVYTDEAQSKRQTLQRFLESLDEIPDDFLASPPFIDDSGDSYAYFLVQKEITPYARREWVERHLSFFKTSELKVILAKYQIESPEFEVISRLTDMEMEDVIRGLQVVMTKDYLLFKNDSRFGFSPLSYWIYDAETLGSKLADGKYELVPSIGDAACLYKAGSLCWTYNSKHALGYLYRYSVTLLLFAGALFLTLLGVYLHRIFEKAREHRKHRLALQVLSHEFRTPVSSMLLLIEQLRDNQSPLPPADHDLIMRLSTDVYRLQRVIEVSKTYLQAESRRIKFRAADIPSINNWILDFVAESGLEIRVDLLSEDRGIHADPFWLKFVLSSLVQNAFAHGQAPVKIKLKNSGGKLSITVEDEGKCEFNSLNQMTDAFVKSSRSKGMGLGLNIVNFIVTEWGHDLRFSPRPTAFTLSLKNQGAGL